MLKPRPKPELVTEVHQFVIAGGSAAKVSKPSWNLRPGADVLQFPSLGGQEETDRHCLGCAKAVRLVLCAEILAAITAYWMWHHLLH